MISSELRAEARKSLTGKWGKAALMMLVYGIITITISFVLNFIPVIGPIVSFIIDLPIGYGLLVSFIKLKRGEDVGYIDFLNLGFSSFSKVWVVFGNTILKMIIPIVLVIVFLMLMIFGGAGSAVGVVASSSSTATGFGALAIIGLIGYLASLIYAMVKGFLYSLTYYILYDNPNMPAKDIVEESARLMLGNRWRLFWLPITFIGWAILATFTLGIGYLWLAPYMIVTLICFYEDLAGRREDVAPVVGDVRHEEEVPPVVEPQASIEEVKTEVEPEASVEETNPISEDTATDEEINPISNSDDDEV